MTKKIVVPDGMLNAAAEAVGNPRGLSSLRKELEAALRWLSANPIVPETGFGTKVIYTLGGYRDAGEWIELGIKEWQCRMFLAPEPEVPEVIADLLVESQANIAINSDTLNNTIIEAYRRGLTAPEIEKLNEWKRQQKSVHTESGG